jgi:8-oxo-dGTP pyrophosphatase MutT (NUDIX family)
MALSPPDIVSQLLAHRPKQTVGGQSLTPASVLLLLYPKDGEYCVLLNKRSQLVEHHKGEISFPGGARDPVDRDSLDTALRETEEEMGVDRSDVTILGEMDEVITRSHFKVNVYVGTIPYPYAFKPSVDEIAEVLEIPVTDLNEPLNHRVETRLDDGVPVTSRSYAYNEHLVFGATAKILQQFLELLEDGTAKEEH